MPGFGSKPLFREAHTAARRLLGEWNRIRISKSAGSLAREAWLYRLPSTFHPSTLQCAAYSLARLYLLPHPDNPFHQSVPVLSAIRDSIAFTRSLQHRDGSFPEWYPSQESFCSTSYLASYHAMVLPLFGKDWAGENRDWLFRAGRWIAGNLRTGSSNQLAAAACALACLSRWISVDEFDPDRNLAVQLLLKGQTPEGWFPEQGGADLGYQSLTLDFLVRIRERLPSKEIDSAIHRGLYFLETAVLPDGTVPPICSRRGTNFLMPFAVVSMSESSEAARALRGRLFRGIELGILPTPSTVDSRNCAHLFLPSFLDAAIQELRRDGLNQAPHDPAGFMTSCGTTQVLPEAGLARFASAGLHVIVSAGAGGSLQGLVDGTPPSSLYDAGYIIRADGRWFLSAGPSQFVCKAGRGSPNESSLELHISGKGATVPRHLLESPGFRRNAAILGGAAASWIGLSSAWERLLRRKAFGDPAPSPLRFERTVRIGESGIHVEDRIRNPSRRKIEQFRTASLPMPSAQPSSQFFSASDLGRTFPLDAPESKRIASILTRDGEISISRTYVRKGSGWILDAAIDGISLQAGADGEIDSGDPEEYEP